MCGVRIPASDLTPLILDRDGSLDRLNLHRWRSTRRAGSMDANELFVFGQSSQPENLAAEARKHASGIYHNSRMLPRDPGPGEDVHLQIDVGVESAVDDIVVRYSIDASRPDAAPFTAKAQLKETVWDPLAFRFIDRWEAPIAGQHAGTKIRYFIEGTSRAENRVVYAHDSDDSAPEEFGYEVDDLGPPDWIKDAVIYQIFVDRFATVGESLHFPRTGRASTLRRHTWGIIERLDYVQNLGINALWITPIFPSETEHGYDALDYERISDHVGGDKALRDLISQAHDRGIRVLMDLAANHCSWHHPFFIQAQSEERSAYRDWFSFSEWPDQYRSFADTRYLPQLNTRNPQVRAYLAEVATYYVRTFGVDGFRLDHAIGPTLMFWSEFRTALREARSDTYTVGEVTLGPDGIRAFEGRLDGCLDFPLLWTMRRFFVTREIDASAFHESVRRADEYYAREFSRPAFLDNHDMNRYLWLVGGDKRRLRLAATWQMSLSQPPVVYYGTELGLSQERDVAGVGFDAARLPMPWDKPDLELLGFYRRLVGTRNAHASLRRGASEVVVAQGGVYVYARVLDGDRVIVALNNSESPQLVEIPAKGIDVLYDRPVDGRIRLEAWDSAIIILN